MRIREKEEIRQRQSVLVDLACDGIFHDYDKDNTENESNSISPDESIRMENKEETESSR